MIDRQQVARLAAPAAFLLAVTVLVLLVRSAISDDDPAATSPAAATTPAPATTAQPADTAPAATAPAATTATTAAGSTHTIESGDTLQTIAEQYGTTVDELLALNSDVDPTALQIGQTIRVP